MFGQVMDNCIVALAGTSGQCLLSYVQHYSGSRWDQWSVVGQVMDIRIVALARTSGLFVAV